MIQIVRKFLLCGLLLTLLPIVMLRWWPPPVSAFMLHAQLEAYRERDESFRIQQQWIPLEEIAPTAALAVVAAEDQLFDQHFGFDLAAMEQALRNNEAGHKLRGASTLSQQTAKNLFLYSDQSYVRKALEAYLTILLELILPKQRILEIYLNIAQFGRGIYGVQAASMQFFHKSAAHLTASEAALLAAVLPNPIRLEVDHPSPYVRGRQAWILKQMKQLGGITYLRDILSLSSHNPIG
ncbi:MAG: monofunctional biosynthetic peptidoglycan transglycosylase [Methylococcaceae bacterium]